MKNIWFMLTFLAILAIGGCLDKTTQPTNPIPNGGTKAPISPPAEIQLTESPEFDTKLAQEMGKPTKRIIIPLPESIDPDEGEMPEQLAKWIAFIKENEGNVDYEPLAADMSAGEDLQNLISVFMEEICGWFEGLCEAEKPQEQQIYQPAENYHARLCYRRDDNLVTKIVFVERSLKLNKFCPDD